MISFCDNAFVNISVFTLIPSNECEEIVSIVSDTLRTLFAVAKHKGGMQNKHY